MNSNKNDRDYIRLLEKENKEIKAELRKVCDIGKGFFLRDRNQSRMREAYIKRLENEIDRLTKLLEEKN